MVTRLSLALLPSEAALLSADCYIVVDALRATTTLATIFSRGALDLWVADEMGLARELAVQHDAVLVGEVGGLRPDGFTFGNSPAEIEEHGHPIERAVMFTTNGTRALCSAAQRGVTFAGALVNASAVASAVQGFAHVALVCAGESGGQRFALEDFAAAAAVARRLIRAGQQTGYDDATRIAIASDDSRSREWMADAEHAEALRRLGLEQDVAFASRPDVVSCAPRVVEAGSGWARLRDASA
jgi:2-phosphosulfolactate phosphatase